MTLGPLLFNKFLTDIFYFGKRSYTNDNVLYAFGSELKEVKENVNQDLWKWAQWFYENCMLLNPDKCHHHMCLGKDAVDNLLQFCEKNLQAREPKTVLGKVIENKLNFESHIKSSFH